MAGFPKDVERELDIAMNDWKKRMRKSVGHLAERLAGIRSGTVDLGFVNSIRVDGASGSGGIRRFGSVRQQGDRILVSVFDRANAAAVVKALVDARLNAYLVNPETVSVTAPPISGEQRAEVARHVKKLGEEAKVAVRAVRQDVRKFIESTGRGSRNAVQEATDAAVREIDELVKKKLAEITE